MLWRTRGNYRIPSDLKLRVNTKEYIGEYLRFLGGVALREVLKNLKVMCVMHLPRCSAHYCPDADKGESCYRAVLWTLL